MCWAACTSQNHFCEHNGNTVGLIADNNCNCVDCDFGWEGRRCDVQCNKFLFYIWTGCFISSNSVTKIVHKICKALFLF